MKKYHFFVLLLLYIVQVKAQQKPKVIIIPQTSFGNLCTLEQTLSLDDKMRDMLDTVEGKFKEEGYKVAGFLPTLRKLKQAGGCDMFNAEKTQMNLAKLNKSDIYILADIKFEESHFKGSYASVALTAYSLNSQEQITYKKAKSNRFKSDNVPVLTTRALNKIFPSFEKALLAKFQPTQSSENLSRAKPTQRLILNADISRNIPQTQMQNPHAIAVVIGNTNYRKTKPVSFARNDASLMKKYLIQTLGYKEGNIFYLEDISKGDFELYFGTRGNHKGKLFNTVKQGISDIFIFYSGHGAPSLKDKASYFVPVECDPNYVELSGYATEVFYQNLAKIPAKSITVVLDACFSGTNIFENISPIFIKSKGILGIQKGTLFASCDRDEVSTWYNAQGQGLFTYFFLKAIHNRNADTDQNGQLTFKEIYNYVSDRFEGVPYFARKLHGIEQNPTFQGENHKQVFVEY